MNVDRWVDDRLAALEPSAGWQPEAARAYARLQRLDRAAHSRRVRWIWAGASAAAVACAAMLVLPSPSACATPRGCSQQPAQSALPKRSPSALAVTGPSGPFAIQRIGAPPLTLSQYRGKVVVLAFISTVCPHCQRLIGELKPLSEEYGPRGVQFLAVAFNDNAQSGLSDFMDRYRPGFPVGWSPRAAVLSYLGISVLDNRPVYVPHMVFLDREGHVRGDFPGGSSFFQDPAQNVRAELDGLLSADAAAFKQIGSPTAPITCELYIDLQCPPCKKVFEETVQPLIAEYVRPGKARLVFHDFPLAVHAYARSAARYANAAGHAGHYILAFEQLFKTQQAWSADGDIDSALSAVLPPGEMRRVREMVKAPRLDGEIEADIAAARANQITVTPSLVIVTKSGRRTLAPIPSFDSLKGYLGQ